MCFTTQPSPFVTASRLLFYFCSQVQNLLEPQYISLKCCQNVLQKLSNLGNAASALQQKVASEASSSTGSFDTKLTAADQTVGAITNYVGQAAMSHEDAVRAAIDAWQASAGTRAGDFQSMLMSLADAHSQLVADRLGLLG